MHAMSRADRVKIFAWATLRRAAFVASVLAVSLVPGVSTLGAVVIVSVGLLLWTAVGLVFPANRRVRQSGGGNPPRRGLGGDRSPLEPHPFNPAGAMERPIPQG